MARTEPTPEMIDSLARVLQNELRSMSGYVLFEITVQWCESDYKMRKTTMIYRAKTSMEALRRALLSHNENTLRDISVRWLTPVECVIADDDDTPEDKNP